MATLVWDQVGDRSYELGVSKGVLYKEDGFGVSWNGLIAVEETIDNEVEPVHFDGVKFNDIVTIGDFSAVLRAFTYPDEFDYYQGILEAQDGFFVTGQPLAKFGLSYRTEIGNDVSGAQLGYKIHILYNLTAIPSTISRQTISESIDPLELEWTISAIPEDIETFRATAHVIFDSRKLDPLLLLDLEGILYGDEDSDPRLPSLKGLAAFVDKWDRLIIEDHGDGTWSATSSEPGVISMLDADTFQIISDTADYLDADTYTIESSDKNEEDV